MADDVNPGYPRGHRKLIPPAYVTGYRPWWAITPRGQMMDAARKEQSRMNASTEGKRYGRTIFEGE